jgi:hypothetical protein
MEHVFSTRLGSIILHFTCLLNTKVVKALAAFDDTKKAGNFLFHDGVT